VSNLDYSSCIARTTFGDSASCRNAFWLILRWWLSECTVRFCISKMYNTGWAESRPALDCLFTFMTEILGGN